MPFFTPDIVLVGHVCRDLVSQPPSSRVGGSVFYGASAASRLGASVGIVTAGGREVEALRTLPGAVVINLETKKSTSFRNEYVLGQRQQYVGTVAPRIPEDLVPPEWQKAPLVLLAPVADEVPASFARLFPHALVGICAQGYMRRWDADGLVKPKPWERATDVLPHVAAVFFSEEDLAGQTPGWLTCCGPVLVMTRAARGCGLIHCGKRRSVSGFPAEEIDSTGAGDVFAAAFMLELGQRRDPIHAARFANCVASYSVTAPGAEGLPDREQVNARLSMWKSS